MHSGNLLIIIMKPNLNASNCPLHNFKLINRLSAYSTGNVFKVKAFHDRNSEILLTFFKCRGCSVNRISRFARDYDIWPRFPCLMPEKFQHRPHCATNGQITITLSY